MAKVAFVDQDMCIGCGIYVNNLPDVFQFIDNGKAECFDPSGAAKRKFSFRPLMYAR